MATNKCFVFGGFLLISLLSCANAQDLISLGRTNVNEWFAKKIEPIMFNLTRTQPDQFEYRFSLRNYPDLPSWLRFTYSSEYGAGFLYGTPPEQLSGHEVSLPQEKKTKQFHKTNIFRFCWI